MRVKALKKLVLDDRGDPRVGGGGRGARRHRSILTGHDIDCSMHGQNGFDTIYPRLAARRRYRERDRRPPA